MARARLRIEGEAAGLTVPTFLSYVCDNLVDDPATGGMVPCGAWITPRLDEPLPDCEKCKAAKRRWRVATPAEVAEYDRRFQEHLQRFAAKA